MESAEQDADDMNFTDGGGDFLSLPAAAAATLRLSTRVAAGARVTSANSHNHGEGDPVPEAEQGSDRDPEDILDPRAVSSPSPSNTVPCTETTSDASPDEVPMDVHPGAKTTKRRALAQPANNEDRDFKTEVKDTSNDIKKALRAVVESIAVLDSRVTKIEADQVKALQSAEATPAQVIPKVRIVQKVATGSVSQERAFEGPNNGWTP
ncbi:hypothetical protein MRX96_024022 [Rhipicephalus microplus]